MLGARGRIVGEFEEIESGAASQRPKLNQAIQLASVRKATLVIAKLDRLARNLHFISRLMESGVEFVAADLPYANKLTVHIIAAVAEYEREMIAQRTKAALRAAKAKGVRLGNPNAARQARAASNKARAKADEFAEQMAPRLVAVGACGTGSYSATAAALNELGIRTQRGKDWTPTGVRNITLRARRLKIL